MRYQAFIQPLPRSEQDKDPLTEPRASCIKDPFIAWLGKSWRVLQVTAKFFVTIKHRENNDDFFHYRIHCAVVFVVDFSDMAN